VKLLNTALVIILCLLARFSGAEKITVPVGVYDEHYEVFKRALASEKCPSAVSYPIEGNQVLAELLLLCEALELGGLEAELDLKPSFAYTRLLRQLDSPDLAVLGFGVWRRDLDPKRFYISSPISPSNKFVKGIYVLPSNKIAMQARSREDVKQLVALTNPSWSVDGEAIRCIGSKTRNARTYVNMFPMIGANRADYLLTTFPAGQNLNIKFYDVALSPIPGVKVVLNDTLHFAVNKNYPDGKKIFDALQRGLNMLNEKGALKYVHERLGLSNPVVDSWINIGCNPDEKN